MLLSRWLRRNSDGEANLATLKIKQIFLYTPKSTRLPSRELTMADKNEDGSVDEITACPDCKGTHLKRDYDHAEIVCADCGLVLEDNIVDTGPEWRAFDMQQENALARAGPPMSTTLPDKG